MPDYYHGPALVLTTLFLPAFGYLYFRYRNIRSLLWFLAFLFAMVSMVLMYEAYMLTPFSSPWWMALGQTALQISSSLFMASLSPLKFKLGRFHVLYAVPYFLPLVAYSILFYGVFRGVEPTGALYYLFPILGAFSFVAALAWSTRVGSIPIPVSFAVCAAAGVFCYAVYFTHGAGWVLTLVQSGNLLMTALLIVYSVGRFSPGVLLGVLGFVAWALQALEVFPAIGAHPTLQLHLIHVIVMGKVVAAVGMILLALEDELNFNQVARERERRARRELVAYANLVLARRRVEDFDRMGDDICATVVANSRFTQAALLMERGGKYKLCGSAGMEPAMAGALGEVAARISVQDFPPPGTAMPAVENSQTLQLELSRWLLPGDDLKQMHAGPLFAVRMQGRAAVEGMLLLISMRSLHSNAALDRLRREDLLPIEMLTARLQATRSQTQMLEKLIDAERYAGLGQLAANVTQQLNNPLTVILGYASLLEDGTSLSDQERKHVEAILAEARRMRSTLETLLRVSHPNGDNFAAVSIAELLSDMERLCRTELLHHSIEFRIEVAPNLPRALCSAQQIRQAILHCLQFCAAALDDTGDSPSHEEPKTICIEARAEGNYVQILAEHSGRSFLHPDRAFDPFASSLPGKETAGLGLSLCATILRDNNGRASAINLEPHGAAILLELPMA